MAHLVLGIGTSHGPSIQQPPERWVRLAESDTRDPRFNFEEARKNAPPNMESRFRSRGSVRSTPRPTLPR